MFDMIVYVSAPYSIEHKETQAKALTLLSKNLGKIYSRNPKWAAVNALFSMYENPQLEDKAVEPRVLQGTISSLLRSCAVLIVLRQPGWEYSDIVLTECACASALGIPIVYEDI